MRDSKLQPQRAILGEDGELRDAAAASESQRAPIYCIQCGTANRAEGRFCRNCGQSLDEQAFNPASLDDYLPPEQKNKRLVEHAASVKPSHSAPSMTFGMVVIEIVTMIVMGALTYVFASMNLAGVALGVLMAWFLMVAARHGALN
jgi:hypothetical protein